MLMLLNLNLTGDCQTIDAEARTDLLFVVKYNQFMCSGILAYLCVIVCFICASCFATSAYIRIRFVYEFLLYFFIAYRHYC